MSRYLDGKVELSATQRQKLSKTRVKLRSALRLMGLKYLKPRYRKSWTPDNPTAGYCYIVSEVIHHFLLGRQSIPHVVRLKSGGTHWFLKLANGKIIDWTGEQFRNPIPYSQARPTGFLTKTPSRRCMVLADHLELR